MALPQAPSDAGTYGMPADTVGFRNYQGVGVIDPTTDQGADAANQELIDLACLTRTGLLARVTFTTAAAAAPTGLSWQAMWTAGTPVMARTALGVVTCTLPASVTDYLGRTRAITVGGAWIVAQTLTAVWAPSVTWAANVITVSTFSTAAAASDIAGTKFTLYAMI